jgi:hypothetical protein
LFPVKALSKVLGLNIVRLYKRKADNYTRVKKQLWENSGSFCQKPLEVLNRWWNI